MPPRRAKQALRRSPPHILVPVPAFVDGWYWYLPQPGDPLYDAWMPCGGAEVVHVTPLAELVLAWFAGNPDSYIIGTLGYLPAQFVGPLTPPTRGEDVGHGNIPC